MKQFIGSASNLGYKEIDGEYVPCVEVVVLTTEVTYLAELGSLVKRQEIRDLRFYANKGSIKQLIEQLQDIAKKMDNMPETLEVSNADQA
jgi:hypothetical protein